MRTMIFAVKARPSAGAPPAVPRLRVRASLTLGTGVLLWLLLPGSPAAAQTTHLILENMVQPHSGSAMFFTPQPHAGPHPGYLGVSLIELDKDQVERLHLKDTRGALILSVDRDAPAAAAGLRAHDVILELNGQRINNLAHLRQKLRDMSAGTAITLHIGRDGIEQTISVRLGDEAEIEQRAWEQHFDAPGIGSGVGPGTGPGNMQGPPPADLADDSSSARDASPSTNFVAPGGHAAGSNFLGKFSINTLYTGAQVDPLSTQLAEYFGVHDGAGLLVRDVTENSPAAIAGLRAGDVILRVNNQAVVSRMDWTRQLHANRGHSVQLSVIRNRHEQMMTMTAGTGKKG